MNAAGAPNQTTALGHSVNIGERVVCIPTGWSIRQNGPLTLCGSHELKQGVALCDGGQQRPENIHVKGQRTAFRGKLFSGHLEESVIPPSFMERLLFRRKPHFLNKLFWSLVLLVPVLGWFFYAGLFRVPGYSENLAPTEHFDAAGGGAGD